MKLVSILIFLVLAGCITVSPPTSMAPTTAINAPKIIPQAPEVKDEHERLAAAIKLDDENREACISRVKQNHIKSAIGFVSCWSEPTSYMYRQTGLLIMDLVEQQFDIMYRAAAMYDNDKLTFEQFRDIHNRLQTWFVEEVVKRFAGQPSVPTPAPSASAVTTHYK